MTIWQFHVPLTVFLIESWQFIVLIHDIHMGILLKSRAKIMKVAMYDIRTYLQLRAKQPMFKKINNTGKTIEFFDTGPEYAFVSFARVNAP